MRNDGNVLPQAIQLDVVDVVSSDEDGSGFRFVKSVQQPDQRALAGTRSSNDCNSFPG